MAKVRTRRLSWNASPDTDIVSYKVYVAKEGTTLDYSSVNVTATGLFVDIPSAFPAGTFATPGNYQLGVAAVDSQENESDMAVLVSPFDFVAPRPPTNLVVSKV